MVCQWSNLWLENNASLLSGARGEAEIGKKAEMETF
jgi:hypothetical protein